MTFKRLWTSLTPGVLLLSAALLVCSCAEDDFGVLEGTVTVNGQAAEAIIITVTGEGAEFAEETGILGGFAFDLFPGEYTVAITGGLPPRTECTEGLSQEAVVLVDELTLVNFACSTTPEE